VNHLSTSEKPHSPAPAIVGSSPIVPATPPVWAPAPAPAHAPEVNLSHSVCSTPRGFGGRITRGNEEEAEFNDRRGSTCAAQGNYDLACENWIRAILTTNIADKKRRLRPFIRAKCPTHGIALADE
jgi:hypothetical protein